MSYVNSKEMLEKASKNGYAVGAFNAENMEFVQAIISAAEEMNSPVIIQTTPGSIKYAGLHQFSAMVRAEAEKAKVDVCLHLDHGDSVELCKDALEKKYSSIMIDGSKLPFEENISLVKVVVDMAHDLNIPVEAELGKLGGKEDSLISTESAYTDPDDAKIFVEKTGIDTLAVAIGTAHGVYKTKPILDKERVSMIKKVVSVPLVLHGSSGLTDEDVRDCISRGIAKVNFATELRQAFSNAVKEYVVNNDVLDPKKYLILARDAVKEQVKKRILVCGSDGKNGVK